MPANDVNGKVYTLHNLPYPRHRQMLSEGI